MIRTVIVLGLMALATACDRGGVDGAHDRAVQRDGVAGHEHSDVEQRSTGMRGAPTPIGTPAASQNTAGTMTAGTAGAPTR